LQTPPRSSRTRSSTSARWYRLLAIQNDVKEFGTVISIGDGIARVVGLNKVQAG
jgi:F0F1-type ATP synthase alpha subunit